MVEEKVRKRSQRVQLACDPCKAGKLKCNRQTPVCDQCYKRSRESSCKYTERGLRYNAAKSNADSMKEKIDRLEIFINRLKDSRTAGVPAPAAEVKKDESASTDRNQAERELSPLTGNLRLSDTGSTQYVGPSHWESIIEDISDVKEYFEIENSPGSTGTDEEASLAGGTVTPADFTFGISQCYSLQDLLQCIPPKAEMDRLVATWFNVMDTARLILHAPTFQQQYQRFWLNPSDASPAWLAALFAVASLGAETSGQFRGDTATLVQAEDLRRLTSHALVLANWMVPQPYVIEALLLHVKSVLTKLHNTTPRIFQTMGQVMRLCFQAGYHRDPAGNPAISPFDCEMRRRVWSLACEYDTLTCYQIGLASLTSNRLHDTAPPGNYVDSDFSPEHVPPPRSSEDYNLTMVGIHYAGLVSVFGDVIKCSNSILMPTRAEIKSLDDRLNGARDGLPANLKMMPIGECFLDSPGQILNRFRMEFLYLKGLCVLYRRFLGESGYEQEHRRCLHAAESLVGHHIPFRESSRPGGQLSSCTVLMERYVHDFNLAAMLLCYELKRQTTTSASTCLNDDDDDDFPSRIRRMLLHVCALWKASGITAPRARNVVRATELFLQQDSQASAQPFGDLAVDRAGSANTPATDAISPSSSSSGPPNLNIDISFGHDYGNEALMDPVMDFQAALNIEEDPMFLDIFGANFSTQY